MFIFWSHYKLGASRVSLFSILGVGNPSGTVSHMYIYPIHRHEPAGLSS